MASWHGTAAAQFLTQALRRGRWGDRSRRLQMRWPGPRERSRLQGAGQCNRRGENRSCQGLRGSRRKYRVAAIRHHQETVQHFSATRHSRIQGRTRPCFMMTTLYISGNQINRYRTAFKRTSKWIQEKYDDGARRRAYATAAHHHTDELAKAAVYVRCLIGCCSLYPAGGCSSKRRLRHNNNKNATYVLDSSSQDPSYSR